MPNPQALMEWEGATAAIMENGVIARPAQITPRWLTGVLRDAGALGTAQVTAVATAHWRGKTMSDLYRIEAAYAGGADPDAPTRFVLKLARADDLSAVADRRRWKEHEFYTRIVPSMDDPPVPRPFSAVYDPRQRRSHLLLEDLGPTHAAPSSPLPPRRDQLEAAVDCLARIHAWWWNHPDTQAVKTGRDEAWIAAKSAAARRRLDRFYAQHGDHLPQAMRAPLNAVADAWPGILRRTATSPLTVVHGDAHPWNFLYSRADDGHARLLDWEGWSIEPGPHDLASLFALHLPASERRVAHDELIDHYAARLRDHGVADSGADCWADYRWAVSRRVLSPVGLWSRGAKARVWWSTLEHVTEAYHELQCRDVL